MDSQNSDDLAFKKDHASTIIVLGDMSLEADRQVLKLDYKQANISTDSFIEKLSVKLIMSATITDRELRMRQAENLLFSRTALVG